MEYYRKEDSKMANQPFVLVSSWGGQPATPLYKDTEADVIIAFGRKLYEGRNEGIAVVGEIRDANTDEVFIHAEEENLVARKGQKRATVLPTGMKPLVSLKAKK